MKITQIKSSVRKKYFSLTNSAIREQKNKKRLSFEIRKNYIPLPPVKNPLSLEGSRRVWYNIVNFNLIMAVKIRLQRQGRKKRPFYQIVIANSKSPRDGRFIERIGSYNPLTKPATIEIDQDKAFEWLQKGAQPTDTVRAILRFKGVLYRKHIQLGVKKGAFSQEEADAKVQGWMDAKLAKISSRKEKADKEIADFKAKVAGVGYVKPKVEVKEELAPEAPAPLVEEVVEETPVAVETAATEEVVAEEQVAAPEAEATEPTEEAAPAEETESPDNAE